MYQQPDPHSGDPRQPPDPSIGGWGLPPSVDGGTLQPYGAGDAGPQLLTLGDISVSQHMVVTPAGRFPLRGSVWTVTDMSRTERTTPAWAIVVAILTFLWTCLLGLLFLLAKETRTTGHIQVTVQREGHFHATVVPANSPMDAQRIHQQVNYVRSLSG
ncbi:hypothetical protein IDM40_06880 [Nocardiopsis sp. HNM0947]|uniref:Uncharacterized protein n=1 Tax=Nocardiopsis coralli TaxID=2772213 RepID=A0ABR9P3W6_9ACTN|nr:hypothetical protein [Nocardiopsis coralli]MBE2998430.1 hypothetical protein [Nocardiopsis coralli]